MPDGSIFNMSAQDRDIAIRTMLGEEGDPLAQAGVASTMINRARTGQYGGTTLKSVALAPGQFEPWASRPKDLLAIPTSDPGYVNAGKILDGVAVGDISDPTGGATHFYAPTAQKALGRKAPAWDDGSGIPLGKSLFFAPKSPGAPASAAIVKAGAKPQFLADFPSAAPSAPKAGAADATPQFLKDFPGAAAPAQSATPAPVTEPSAPQFLQDFPAAAGSAAPRAEAAGLSGVPFPPSFDAKAPIGPTTPAPTVGQQILGAARDTAGYLGGQIAGIPAAVAQDFNAGNALTRAGNADPNKNPSFPSLDPRTWSAGGDIKAIAGTAGQIASPLTGTIRQLVQDPVTQATGNPDIGERAGFVANSLSGPMLGPVAKAGASQLSAGIVGDISPETAQLADLARTKYAILLTAGQMSDSPAVRFTASTSSRMPLSGAGDIAGTQQTAFNRAVAGTIGETADKITPDVMVAAKKRIGDSMNNIAANTIIRVDNQFASDLSKTMNDAATVLPDVEVAPLRKQIGNILDNIDPNTGVMSGDQYQALTRKGTPLDRALSSSDPNIKFYAGQIKDALDDVMQRSAGPAQASQLSKLRFQYKNMKTIEDLAEKSPTGDVSPALLMGAVRGNFSNMAYGGGGDLGDLARIGQRFLKEPPSSGTAERLSAMNAFGRIGAAAGSGVFGLHEALPGIIPETAASVAATIPATLAASRATSMFLRSPWVADNMINRSLGRPTSHPLTVPQNLLSGAVTTLGGVNSGLSNKLINPPATANP